VPFLDLFATGHAQVRPEYSIIETSC
jgi:hypothetical protein